MKNERLDKYLSLSGERSRTEATRLIRAGLVTVNGVAVREPAMKVSDADIVALRGEIIPNGALQYYLLHKPAGVLTAANDAHAPTVMGLVPEALVRRGVQPVGRLDKDVTGLLLLTNDGALAHRLLSPKRHVWKRYTATVTGRLSAEDVRAFAEGLPLGDFTALPARLYILVAGDEQSVAEVEVREGKFHQVKRMFLKCGHEVVRLCRTRFGTLVLPDDLPAGGYRPLTDGELDALRNCMDVTKGANTEETRNE